jgi:Ca2+-binding EF-hand superfamily protein
LFTVQKAIIQNISEDGTLNRKAYTTAFNSLNVLDQGIINRTFDIFDARKDGEVDFREVMTALDVILNGTNKHITLKDCFALFDPTSCGYIIKNLLFEMRTQRMEPELINHMMIKVLLSIFDKLQKDEDEKYLKEWSKKSKRRPKPPPKSSTADASKPTQDKSQPQRDPPMRAKKIHLSYDEFCTFMASDPLLVQAFLTRILLTMEVVYLRNKKSASLHAKEGEEKFES